MGQEIKKGRENKSSKNKGKLGKGVGASKGGWEV